MSLLCRHRGCSCSSALVALVVRVQTLVRIQTLEARHLWALECLNTCKCVSALARVSVEDQGTVTMEGKERKVMTMQTKATAMDRLGYVRKVTAMDGLGCVHVQKGTAMDGLDYMCMYKKQQPQ
eukprot:scaffold30900_cov19-Tisochrysis_lutea.AAC.1